MYDVIKDTREQKGWFFTDPTLSCSSLTNAKLDTGDYTIKGYEQKIIVERKGSVSEVANNLSEDRFFRELDRLESFAHPFIIMEFTLDEFMRFPHGAMPANKARFCKITPQFLLMKLNEIQFNYKTKLLFCGRSGEKMAASLFKRAIKKYG